MLLHFLIIFSILAFIFTIIYALFSIVVKIDFKPFNVIIQHLKRSTLSPVAYLLFSGIIFFLLYILFKSTSYQNIFNTITTDGSSIGALGDLFNGLIAPTVSIISIIYLWRAFVQQFRANQMLYNFEIEKSFKDDLEWLRNNSSIIEELEKGIEKKNNEEIGEYLSSTEITKLRKVIYIINIFEQFYIKLNSKKSKENDFSDVNHQVLMILESLYLPTMKNIYRTFGNYVINFSEEQKNNLDRQKSEIQYLQRFSKLYNEVPDLRKDNLFEVTLKTINKIIN